MSPYVLELAGLMTAFPFRVRNSRVTAGALVVWFVGMSRFLTIPAIRNPLVRAWRWIVRATALLLNGCALTLATETMHG